MTGQKESGQSKPLSEKDHRLLMSWAADCAERVLNFFVAGRPLDDRPLKAIAAGRAWMQRELTMAEARKAAFLAHAAARATENPQAKAAARAAGHAAATAHVASHARHAANYAAMAAGNGIKRCPGERAWQRDSLAQRLHHLAFP